ncbi:hypothetical protein BCV72DRAFT_191742, partial [Rhizopus microsporus var. microsporus]
LAYADDILVFFSDSLEITQVLDVLHLYEQASNAKLNRYKTIAVSLSGDPLLTWQRNLYDHGIAQ